MLVLLLSRPIKTVLCCFQTKFYCRKCKAKRIKSEAELEDRNTKTSKKRWKAKVIFSPPTRVCHDVISQLSSSSKHVVVETKADSHNLWGWDYHFVIIVEANFANSSTHLLNLIEIRESFQKAFTPSTYIVALPNPRRKTAKKKKSHTESLKNVCDFRLPFRFVTTNTRICLILFILKSLLFAAVVFRVRVRGKKPWMAIMCCCRLLPSVGPRIWFFYCCGPHRAPAGR